MPFQNPGPADCYLLPGDGPVAEELLLQHMGDGFELYQMGYAFTLDPMITALLAAHGAGRAIHLYLDHSESITDDEAPLVKRLVAAGVEVTIGTSPAGPQYIAHSKAFTCLHDPPFCWEGSTNFSESAFHQGNTVMALVSPEWSAQFIAQFRAFRQFAWTSERDLQLMSAPPPGVT